MLFRSRKPPRDPDSCSRSPLAPRSRSPAPLTLPLTHLSGRKVLKSTLGVVLFEDEASFWLDSTLHQTWSLVGQQPRIDTYGQRKTAHLFGAVDLVDARFTYSFADVFNGETFWQFLCRLVAKYRGRKVFLIIDKSPSHNLRDEGKAWLSENSAKIELHRLPPCSSEFRRISATTKPLQRACGPLPMIHWPCETV